MSYSLAILETTLGVFLEKIEEFVVAHFQKQNT